MSSFAFMTACRRCSGVGTIEEYSHVEAGRCFTCNGRGVLVLASKDVRAWGWNHTSQMTRIRFVQTGLGLLSAHGEEGCPTAPGWRDVVLEQLLQVLPMLSATHFDAALCELAELIPISDEWVEEHKPARLGRQAA